MTAENRQSNQRSALRHEKVIVGGGAGGIATAASLLKRNLKLDILVVEPRDKHFYQPGFTMVDGGVISPAWTARTTESAMPRDVEWLASPGN